MTDDLEKRLRDADPAKSPDYRPASSSWISSVVEAAMNQTATADQPRRRWMVPAAAAAVLVLGFGGYGIAQLESGGSPSGPVASAQPMRLQAASQHGGVGPQLCQATSVATLSPNPVAFSGRVTSITKTTVTITVDHWYRGGHASKVLVAVPRQGTVQVLGATNWTNGTRYLVTARHGAVNGCGLTMTWTAQQAALFARAFG